MIKKISIYKFFIGLCLSSLFNLSSTAHPQQDLESIQGVVTNWVLAFQNKDVETMRDLLHPDFQAHSGVSPGNAQSFLYNLDQEYFDIHKILLKYAIIKYDTDRVIVEPIEYYYTYSSHPKTLKLTLSRESGQWKVKSIEKSLSVPESLIGDLPEQQQLFNVEVEVSDYGTGHPIHSRIHVEDSSGNYWPPAGHMKNFPQGLNNSVGGDVIVDDKRFAYIDSVVTLPLAQGSYKIDLSRGMEYEHVNAEFKVGAGSIPDLKLSLRRWINMSERGWFSGDTHVHSLSPTTAILEAKGEDVNVVNILATKWGEKYTNVNDFIGRPSKDSGKQNIVYVNQESRHSYLGHTVLLNLKRLVYPMGWGDASVGGTEGVWGGYDYPAMATIAHEVRKQSGLVSWAHFPAPGGEIAADFALQRVDAVDLLTWSDPFQPWSSRGEAAIDAWYRLLNAGYRVPVLGGTDKMFNNQTLGAVRTYVKVFGEFSYDSWIEGIRKGRTFVTTGPMVMMTVNGRDPGDVLDVEKGEKVTVDVVVESRLPVDVVEIIMNGTVVEKKENTIAAKTVKLSSTVSIEEGAWIAGRAYSSRTFSYQVLANSTAPLRHIAHSSPFYVEVNGRGVFSKEANRYLLKQVESLIKWTKEKARFASIDQKEETLETFERARRIYIGKLNSKNADDND